MRIVDLATAKPVADVIGEATGRRHRTDPVLPRTGGPAGNAALTAWTGLTLLVLSIAELLTLFNVTGLISWHVAIGALLIPPALLKTSSTGWRILGYYRGSPPYREAGPPSTAMRLLGPLVVLSTLTLLGSGVLLVLLGEQSARQVIVTLLGFRIDWITVHQASFAVWATATGLHLLGRIFPALRLTFLADPERRVPGATRRISVLVLTAATAALLAVVLVGAKSDWGNDDHRLGQQGQLHQAHTDPGCPPSAIDPYPDVLVVRLSFD